MQTQKLIIYLLLISLACGCIGNDENSDEDDGIDYPEYLEVNDYRVFIFSSTKQKENLSGTFIILPMLMFLNGTTISLTDIYYNVHNHYHWPEIGKEIPSELNISYAMKDFT